jgi:hypothetical protein
MSETTCHSVTRSTVSAGVVKIHFTTVMCAKPRIAEVPPSMPQSCYIQTWSPVLHAACTFLQVSCCCHPTSLGEISHCKHGLQCPPAGYCCTVLTPHVCRCHPVWVQLARDLGSTRCTRTLALGRLPPFPNARRPGPCSQPERSSLFFSSSLVDWSASPCSVL